MGRVSGEEDGGRKKQKIRRRTVINGRRKGRTRGEGKARGGNEYERKEGKKEEVNDKKQEAEIRKGGR
jgi:hypothetical protein